MIHFADLVLRQYGDNMASIFVAISSYRDQELKPTILNILQQASGKHKINFGIHISYMDESEIDLPDLQNIKYRTSRVPENIGVGMGRYIAHQFYNGENFYLQCDSHSRFIKNWDEIIMNCLLDYKIAGVPKPLLTMYPSNYWYKDNTFTEIEKDKSDLQYRSNMSFHEKPQDFKTLRVPSQMAMPCEDSIFTKSISAGSIFTTGPFIEPNKDMAFWGEEIMLAARAYTHGYDLMVPNQQYMYHLYYNWNNPEINRRKIFWQDFPKEFEEMDKKSKDIVYKALTEEITGDGYLGTERSLSEYGAFAGLDFVNGIVFDKCTFHQ